MSAEPSEKRSKVPVTLGYWKIRGLAQPIRLLLKYTGTEFEDVQYDTGESWFSVKFTLGLDFPNLPYLFDGDLKFTESRAIMHYIARKNNLCGGTESEKVAVEMVEGVVDGVKSRFTGMCYNAKFEEMKPDVMKYVNEKLKVLSAYLGEKKWFTGDAITYVDFVAYETLDVLRLFDPEIYGSDLSNIPTFLERFEQLPAIMEYMKSSEFISRPVNSPENSQWSGSS